MAQMRLRQGGFSKLSDETPNLASTDFDSSEDDEEAGFNTKSIGGMLQSQSLASQQKTLHFRNILTQYESTRLLALYQEVVGEYHPILAVDQLVQQVGAWYNAVSNPTQWHHPASQEMVDENNLLIVNIALSIALCAESKSTGSDASDRAKLLYAGCRDLIDAKIMSSKASVKQVVITLLVGIFHFFQDMVRYAWRMVGIAGRTMMELGLHDRNVARHALHSEQQRVEHAVLVSTIATLDRQWSAATGLPTHFGNSHFDQNLGCLTGHPYLKAMATFILMSDKFCEPIARVAAGETYEDDDEFEIMNFQIEQWRQKSVGSYNIGQLRTGPPPNPNAYPPAWAIVLHLRAKAIRILLLRPFFLFNTPAEASHRNLQPALDLMAENIDTLCVLDRHTNIYRMHHACFHDILASTCALLFLIIAYVEQNRVSLIMEIQQDRLIESIARIFGNAFDLAAGYCKSSNASRRLWKRMVQMKKMLVDVGTLPIHKPEVGDGGEHQQQPQQHLYRAANQQPLLTDGNMASSRRLQPHGGAWYGNGKRSDIGLEPAFMDFEQNSVICPSPESSIAGQGISQGFNVEWAVSLSENWQLNNGSGLFFGF
ncbi:hypothetical protein BX600DRAFT_470426 [Xylariales sp. PMI_506]|nr:hypothetical protein BX600DRAFT_470426 [Xylariales sp. PMI_506]